MHIIKVQGGLGNQLLQYGIGQVLKSRFKKEVEYDATFFETNTKYTKRVYMLDKFMIDVPFVDSSVIENTRYPYGKISKIFSQVKRALNKYIFKQYYIGYEKRFFELVQKEKNAYFEGFWQSYKYYEENIDELAKLIVLRDMSAVESFKREYSFDEKVSVSVHIRRGDFTKKDAGTKVVPTEYYREAVKQLEQKIENPTYFVFSDDIEWVKETLGDLFKDVVYVSSLPLADYEEFMILKACKHAILSNSTYCWFSTLLNPFPGKVVFYPNDWQNEFLNKSGPICSPDWHGI